MFSEKMRMVFNENLPALDTLASISILMLVTIVALSLPSPDSYMQDVNINTMTVQSRQVGVPLTTILHPDLGVMYEVGKAGLSPAQIELYQNAMEDTTRDIDYSFMIDSLQMDETATHQYEFILTMDGRRASPSSLGEDPGNYGIAWINHPSCDPNEPVTYIVIKH
jgi:hypothetical protein